MNRNRSNSSNELGKLTKLPWLFFKKNSSLFHLLEKKQPERTNLNGYTNKERGEEARVKKTRLASLNSAKCKTLSASKISPGRKFLQETKDGKRGRELKKSGKKSGEKEGTL